LSKRVSELNSLYVTDMKRAGWTQRLPITNSRPILLLNKGDRSHNVAAICWKGGTSPYRNHCAAMRFMSRPVIDDLDLGDAKSSHGHRINDCRIIANVKFSRSYILALNRRPVCTDVTFNRVGQIRAPGQTGIDASRLVDRKAMERLNVRVYTKKRRGGRFAKSLWSMVGCRSRRFANPSNGHERPTDQGQDVSCGHSANRS
jgi:hypothetical protein